MTKEQIAEFESRRADLMRAHILNHPDLARKRRRRSASIVLGLVRYAGAVALMLFLIKSMTLAMHGPEGYARLIAPVLAQSAPDGVLARALARDPWSDRVATTVSSVLPGPIHATAHVPAPRTLVDADSDTASLPNDG